MSSQIWIGLFAVASLALLASLVLKRSWRPLRKYAERCAVCGHLPEPPTPRSLHFLKKLCRCLVWIQVGKIEVDGLENLLLPGPKIIAPNHPHSVDPFVFPLFLSEGARYMTARGVMKFCGGLGALILAPCGAFCADLRQGRGLPALRAAVRVVSSGQSLVVFPEGWAHLDGVTRRFKRGVAHVARQAAARLGHAVPIVPVHLRHGAHPGPWINRLNPRLQFLLVALAFPIYRRGLRITVGAPIPSSDLAADETLAVAQLRDVILSLGSSDES